MSVVSVVASDGSSIVRLFRLTGIHLGRRCIHLLRVSSSPDHVYIFFLLPFVLFIHLDGLV